MSLLNKSILGITEWCCLMWKYSGKIKYYFIWRYLI